MPGDRVALVTGTSSGIGLAVARLLVEKSWDVVGVARRRPPIDSGRYTYLTLDLGDTATASRGIEAAVGPLIAEPGRSRVALVNNAAMPGPLASVERIDVAGLVPLYAVNVAMPVWLMGFFVGHTSRRAALRIVNLSSGAGVRPFAGMAPYCSSKAALRMAGMVVAEELASPERNTPAPADAAILSYEPGIVDTPMQDDARSRSEVEFPWVTMFRRFAASGVMSPPEHPAAEIVDFLETNAHPRFSEKRFAGVART